METGHRVNRQVTTDLRWLPRFGRGYKVPRECLDCVVLQADTTAEVVGLSSIKTPLGTRYRPERDQYKAEEELERRSRAASDGSCRFVIQQACWRLERENV